MKTYRLSFADSISHAPANPERTARKSGSGLNFDVTYQVWPSRAAMAKSIRMQERRGHKSSDWRAVVKLSDGEGY